MSPASGFFHCCLISFGDPVIEPCDAKRSCLNPLQSLTTEVLDTYLVWLWGFMLSPYAWCMSILPSGLPPQAKLKVSLKVLAGHFAYCPSLYTIHYFLSNHFWSECQSDAVSSSGIMGGDAMRWVSSCGCELQRLGYVGVYWFSL